MLPQDLEFKPLKSNPRDIPNIPVQDGLDKLRIKFHYSVSMFKHEIPRPPPSLLSSQFCLKETSFKLLVTCLNHNGNHKNFLIKAD